MPTGRGKNIEAETLRAKEYEDVITRIMKKQQEVDIELKTYLRTSIYAYS